MFVGFFIWENSGKKKEAPQILYNSDTYNIRVKSLSVRHIGSKITVANVEKET